MNAVVNEFGRVAALSGQARKGKWRLPNDTGLKVDFPFLKNAVASGLLHFPPSRYLIFCNRLPCEREYARETCLLSRPNIDRPADRMCCVFAAAMQQISHPPLSAGGSDRDRDEHFP